ncbi:MaoC/PaaZ C-terminal domain-containing protein [Nocardioides rubriscoriae]|uniref:MaoC/PaaZ C-terminal domain-containing protein n=1 Tax=Nocardioides rubriscoriae TaxID=642762 RepID=UPI0011E055A2|nr:MaoC/PaaZ C-terminal domain-containing protein [Nocardioides rubriscoriae]
MSDALAAVTYRVTREALVAYAAASGDHNPIHQDEQVARAVGLPGVIAHGMYTLALAARYVDEQVGERGRIATIGAKFTKPVVVPVEGVDVEVSGVRKDDRTLAVTVTCEGVTVLGRCQVTLRD